MWKILAVLLSLIPAIGEAQELSGTNSGIPAGLPGTLLYPTALPTPAAPVITNAGTPGSTTYTYQVLPVGQLGFGRNSANGATTTGAATLNSTNYNIITTTAIAGGFACDVWRINNPATAAGGGAGKFIGTVTPCGSAINDQNTATIIPASGSQLYPPADYSAGVLFPTNVKIAGSVMIGVSPASPITALGRTQAAAITSGGSILNLANTVTGSPGIGTSDDPINFGSNMVLTPTCDFCVNQPWNMYALTTLSTGNTFSLGAPEGIVSTMNLNGSGLVNSGDGVWTQINVNSSVTSDGALNGVRSELFSFSSGNATGTLAGGYFGTTNAGAGTVTKFSGLIVDMAGNGPITTETGIDILKCCSQSSVVNYRGIHIADHSAIGTTSTFAMDIDGATS